MHKAFVSYVESGKALAESKGMEWNFPLDQAGMSASGWNLTELVGAHSITHYLRDLGQERKTLDAINILRETQNRPTLSKSALSGSWQDFIKAATCDQLLFKRNTTGHVVQNIIRPLKVLATCAGSLEPWQLTADVAREAISLAKQLQPSGKLADLVVGIIKGVMDTNHLAVACPIYPALSSTRLPCNTNRKSRETKSKDKMREDLEQRKRAERLPEKRAFWELIRIIFTENPRTFTDVLRFSALKIMVLTGLRIGEAVMMPADWARFREYYDPKGRPAGELGGYSKALMLRHFSEKQQTEYGDSTVLIEGAQYVPEIFSEILTETLNEAVRITQPLRDILKRQIETGRLLPQYGKNDLVPVIELYTQITGNAFWLNMDKDIRDSFVAKYRQDFNPQVLHELAQYQNTQYWKAGIAGKVDIAMYMYFNRLVNNNSQQYDLLKVRDSSGREYGESRKWWSEAFLSVGELEDYLAVSAPTKLSDRKPLKLQSGELQTWEFLFLTPKRALSEERNGGITDITQYCSVGIPSDVLLTTVLGDVKNKLESLFMRYGKTEKDQALTIDSHMLRHLQNTELFRLGVADTIITKRFNRRSVAQSYEYDHRSLAEELESIELPPETEALLGENATTVAKLIQAGKASGPIVTAFKRIQREEGDDAAFEFLKVEADGFHVTPYGHCINSFTVDPCPKNLECFAGCGHLTATDLPENRRNLEALELRFQAALLEVQGRPPGTAGRKNQLSHATIRLESVRKLLATPSGERVFPDGSDFSKPTRTRSVLDD